MVLDTMKSKDIAKWLNRAALSYEKDFGKTLKLFQSAKPKSESVKAALEGLKAKFAEDLKVLAKFEKEAAKKVPAKAAPKKAEPKKPAKK